MNNPLLAQEIADFSRDRYGPSRARLFVRQPDLGSVAEDNKALQDLNWIGSRFLLNTPGYYDTDYSKSPDSRGPTTPPAMPACLGWAVVAAYPTCKQWWADSGIGLRDRIKDQVDPDLMTSFLKWAKWLNQDEVTEAESFAGDRTLQPGQG
ncbi:conjugal transfer protein TraG N-terminal domain-containing protein [Pseudomonas aeruginosa]|nr:conjugal transfer protein TraG N-terminal domain-containing protein [Pseudomonas aeruginosa]